jgi:hypothetical protein
VCPAPIHTEEELTVAPGHFCLDDTFAEHDLEHWYATAVVGEVALIEIPTLGCVVELRRLVRAHVLWHVQGGRSMTMPLPEALQRLEMLRLSPPR